MFKDRAILDYDPHAVIEGMTLAAYATGATRGFIYLRYEYPETLKVLEHALAEAEAAGLLGDAICRENMGVKTSTSTSTFDGVPVLMSAGRKARY